MYSRKVRVMFAFMAFVMGIGYALMLVVGTPGFNNLFGGTGGNATQKQVDKARANVRKLDCGNTARPPTDKRLRDCKRHLEDLGAGYQSLTQPPDPTEAEPEPEPPAGAERNTQKSLEAFELLYQIDKDDDDSLQFLASAYAGQGKYEQALPLFKLLTEQNPEDQDLLYAYASIAQSASKNTVAIAAFKRFIKLAPDDERAEVAKASIKTLKEGSGAGGMPGGIPGGGIPGGIPGGIG